jgi:hypothetical protein
MHSPRLEYRIGLAPSGSPAEATNDQIASPVRANAVVGSQQDPYEFSTI